jgi:hypothetical protein
MLLGLLTFLIEVVVCIALPTFLTIRTILQPSDRYQLEYKRWIAYWILFIVMNGLFYWIGIEAAEPLKVILLAALAIPRLGLPIVVYD